MRLSRYLIHIYLTFLALSFVGCGDTHNILYTIEELNESHIAVLDNSICNDDFKKAFPKSETMHFKSSSDFLLALAIGKCDAGIVDKEEGILLLDKNDDYERIPFSALENDSTLVIVHKRLLAGRNVNAQDRDIFEKSIERIHRSLISDQYWKLILRGLWATLTMFLLGIMMAFAFAFLMLLMNHHKFLRYISGPISYFIKTIHDVPSVVLIFFFYYVVFATVHISGILVCSIALGVYTSGSLMNVFNVHLNQIDRNQHAAAEMLGLTGWKKYRYVILPQAVKPMLPLIAAESKVLLRATTYAGYISEVDLVKVTEIIRNQTYDVLVPLLLASVIFLALSKLIVNCLSAIYNKMFKYDQN